MFCWGFILYFAEASQNLPYSFGDVVNSLFRKIFLDSEIVKSCQCESWELSYIISEDYGPYLKQKVIDEITKTQC